MKLYGDDFSPEQISKWFDEEQGAYLELSGVDEPFTYRALNEAHFWNRANANLGVTLAMGCGNGKELLQIADRVDHFIAIEPAKSWWRSEIGGKSIEFRMPQPSGQIDLDDSCVDNILCLGVLHHIPNVSAVLGEMARVLKPGGALFLREPINSLGKWGTQRPGLTKNEWGLPLPWLRNKVTDLAMDREYEALCQFPVVPRLAKLTGVEPYNNDLFVRLDSILSRLFAGNVRYERHSLNHKMAAGSVAMILRKAL